MCRGPVGIACGKGQVNSTFGPRCNKCYLRFFPYKGHAAVDSCMMCGWPCVRSYGACCSARCTSRLARTHEVLEVQMDTVDPLRFLNSRFKSKRLSQRYKPAPFDTWTAVVRIKEETDVWFTGNGFTKKEAKREAVRLMLVAIGFGQFA